MSMELIRSVLQDFGLVMMLVAIAAFAVLNGINSAEKAADGETVNYEEDGTVSWVTAAAYGTGLIFYVPHLIRDSAYPGLHWLSFILGYSVGGSIVAISGTVAVCYVLLSPINPFRGYLRGTSRT